MAGHLAQVSPRVFSLDRLIGNFLDRVLVCVFFVLLLLLFCGYLLVAFLPELATTLAVPCLGVSGHRQYRDYRSYRIGSHLSVPNKEKRTEANIEIMANPATVDFKSGHWDLKPASTPTLGTGVNGPISL